MNQRANNEVNFRFAVFYIAVLMIGMRYNVGGDWYTYLWYIKAVGDLGLDAVNLMTQVTWRLIGYRHSWALEL